MGSKKTFQWLRVPHWERELPPLTSASEDGGTYGI